MALTPSRTGRGDCITGPFYFAGPAPWPPPGKGTVEDLELDGVGRLAGEVDFSNEHFLGLRTSNALYRFFGRNSFGAPVGITVHDFSGSGDPDATAKAWGGFLGKVYA
ncbi:hypothetical protein QFZ30_003497 [Arthrobacter pascens]|nr:hypothetical protein [Arthrobacter pascens]